MMSDRTLYEQTPALLQTVDSHGKIMAVSDRWLAWLGYTREDVLGRSWQSFLAAQSRTEAANNLPTECWQTGAVEHVTMQFQTRDGQILDVQVSAQLVRDDGGNAAYCVAALTDVTEARQTQRELERYRAQLEHLVSDRTAELTQTNQLLQAEIAQRQQTEAALQQRERIYRTSFDSAPLGIVHATLDLRLQRVNSKFCHMLGYTAAELGELALSDITHPDDLTQCRPDYARLLSGEIDHFTLEKRYQRKDGSLLWGSATVTVVKDEAQQPLFTIAIIQDISDRKAAENALYQAEYRLQLIAETVEDYFWIDRAIDASPLYTSPKLEPIFGVAASDVDGNLDALLAVVHPEDLAAVEQFIARRSVSTQPSELEFRIQHAQKGVRWLRSRAYPLLNDQGQPEYVVGITSDITEQRQVAEALHHSEERFRLLAENTQDVFWLIDCQTKQNLYINPAFEQIWQLPQSAIAANSQAFLDRVHPEDIDRVLEHWQRLFQSPQDFQIEYRLRLPDGTVKWISDRGSAILNAEGSPCKLAGIATDITANKQAELELRSSQRFLQLVFNNMPQRIFWKDDEGRFLGCNQAFADDMGCPTPAEVIGKTEGELLALTPESLEQFAANDRAALEADRATLFQEQVQHYQDGSVRWVSTTKLPLRTPEGDLIGIFCSYEDITERVLARESLQRYARMIEAAKDGICLLDADFRYQIINQSYRDWYGYEGQPILGQTVAEVLGEDAFERRLKPLLESCLRGETIRYADWFEFPHLGKRFRSVTLIPYVEDSGQITGIITSISDLTALKQSEFRQQQLLEIIEATSNFIGMASLDGEVFYLNPALRNLVPSHAGDSFQLSGNFEQYHPQWASDIILHHAIPTAMAQGTWQGETAILDRDGQEIPIFQTVTAHFDERGEAKMLSTIASDIRRQKHLERELRDRLEFERLVSRISTDFVNLSGQALAAGMAKALQSITEATGSQRSYVYLLSEDLQFGYLFSQWHVPDLPPIPEEWQRVPAAPFEWWMSQLNQQQCIAVNDVQTMPPEATNERLAMESLETQAFVVVPMHHNGILSGYIGFSVTHPKAWSSNEIALLRLVGDLFANAYQRSQAEAALRQQEHYFRSLTERSSDVVMLLDEEGRCQYVTPAVSGLLGYASADLMGRSVTDWVAADDLAILTDTLANAARQPGISQPLIQYRVRHQNHRWRYFEAIATSLLTDPMVCGIVMNCRDVSDRVLAEAAQRRSEQVFKAIFEQSAIAMAQVALDGTYLQVNPAFCQLVGYRKEELIGAHYSKVTHLEDLADNEALSAEVAAGKVPAQVIDKRLVCANGSMRHVQVVLTAVQGDQDGPAFLASVYSDVTEQVMAERSLRSIVEGTSAVVGEDFFPALARQLADSLDVDHIMINEIERDRQLGTLVFWSHNQLQSNFSYDLLDTPCEQTLLQGVYCCPKRVQQVFPHDIGLATLNAESYLGVALINAAGEAIGEICVVHSKPINNLDNAVALLRIFAARASAELERQKSVQALRTSENNWRNILNNMPVLLNAVNEAGIVTLWNKECERVSGYSAEEIIGHPDAFERLYPDAHYRQELAKSWGRRSSHYRDWEWTITCKDGSERIIAWSNLSSLFPIPDLGSWAVGVDVTERRLAEKALRKSEARFQRLATNMPGVVYRYHQCSNGHNFFSYVSPGSQTLWEISPEAACADATRVWNIVHPDDVEAFQQSIEDAIARGQRWFYEHRIITPSGQEKWIQAVAKANHKSNGDYVWEGILIDVTARKEAERALQASEARFQRLAANMPGIIYRYHLDVDGRDRLTYVSPACREIWEIEPDVALQGTSIVWSLVHPDDREQLSKTLLASRQQLTPMFEDYRIITPSGVVKWVKVAARPVQEPDGSCLWDGIIIDITEQQTTQEALQASESLNRAILEALPDLLIRMRCDGLCLDMQYPDSFNVVCPRDRHIGRYVQDTLPTEAAQKRMLAVERALSSGEMQIYEYELLVNGQDRWEEARVVPMSQDEVLILVRDIDDRKRAEQALRQSEALNRAIIGALPDMLIRMTKDGLCLNAQHPDSFPALVNGEAAVGKNIHDMLPSHLVEQRLANIQRALATQRTQVSEYQIEVDGQNRWEESRIVPLTTDEALVLVRDIDERRRAENEVRRLNQILEAQNQRLEELVELRTAELMALMNALPDQIFVVDRATNQNTFGNDVVVQFSNKRCRQEFEGATVYDCFDGETAAYYAAQNRQVFETGEILHVEETISTADGLVHFDTYKIPLKGPDGEVYALIGTSRDVTELVKARQTLEAQAIQLEATNQELQSFSYSVSHDLRAPLRHINGFIAALKQRLEATSSEPDTKVDHYIDVIEKSSRKMGLLIDGLLTLSRVGRREMMRRPVPLGPLAEHAIALIEDLPENAPDRLQIFVDPLPTVQGDPTLLQQVFSNLVSNAVKFSRDRAPAVVHIGQREDGAIFIRDNGVGFDMTYADKLFSPFQRLHRQEEFTGTGIGLAIVNRIIHRHGGHIWAESEINQGTTFYFSLPQESPQDELSS